MNYLLTRFECVIFNHEMLKLEKNVKYVLGDYDGFLVCGINGESPFYFSLELNQKNVLKIQRNNNRYFIINSIDYGVKKCFNMTFQKYNVSISYGDYLEIVIDGNIKYSKYAPGIDYVGYEDVGDMRLIHFGGKRNFLLVIEKDNVVAGDFYDECNISNEEKFFMCRCNDSLNHGKVIHIIDKKVDNYLVYLDDNDLCLKDKFVAHVFLDCIVAGNFKYCNNLLSKELKQEAAEDIKNFFPNFDWFYPIEENCFILTNKNTLAGIYKFDIKDNLIENITSE